mgnify:CR=1 FL=1
MKIGGDNNIGSIATQEHLKVQIPLLWNFFPLNLLFGPLGTFYNIFFVIDFVILQWLYELWNNFILMFIITPILLVFSAIFMLIIMVTLSPWAMVVMIILFVLVVVFINIPLTIFIILFSILSVTIVAFNIIFMPSIIIILILNPFDKLFYAWCIIVIIMVFIEHILPAMGAQIWIMKANKPIKPQIEIRNIY